MKAFLFPGQGSQSIGMGREIYEAFRCAKDVFQEVDEALEQNLTKIIFEGPEADLVLTENAQPALMTVSMALIRVLEKEGGLNLSQTISYMAGHSLGQYSALCTAGSLSLSDAAQLLKIRGQAMQKAVPKGEGAMAALLGLTMDDIQKIVAQATQSQVCEIANDNSPGQVVVSGHREAIERAIEISKSYGAKRSILLNVSAPFHCSLMQPAQDQMEIAFQEIDVKNPSIPILDNVSTQVIRKGEDLKSLLIQQVTGQVRWRESIENLAELGVMTAIEVGAGKILTGLSKRIAPALEAFALNTPYDIESFLKKPLAA
ncbi:MAG: ACP S-malonyltransferase [Alphaproteobacteria bacterium]|jgi:[acyl-carrier-protein] S-malonyltransferase|nr:ACP S-malonyltransferase [Alphaproteobacteria bacterium]MBP9776553.1 ACP S-malonyltransferase [Alphaproteobacteria bacterium]